MAVRHSLAPALAATAAALAVAAPAQAAPLTVKGALASVTSLVVPTETATCAAAPVSKPFARWNDLANYVPAPESGFEQGLKAWTAFGGVSLASDNEPWRVSGRAADTTSVVLSPGASIVSKSFCGGLAYPTVRLFSRSVKSPLATALVTIRYTGRDGLLGALPLGVITAGQTWQPTVSTLTASGLPLLTGTKLGLTITALTGTVAVDDVYVDPFRRS